ncbi:MAG: response regulator transcription factor [Actinomycetota bacterium]
MGPSTIRVLVVDAHPVMRGVARLACEGSEDLDLVAEATDAREALDAVTALSPHVVILDLDLPANGGRDTLVRLREAQYPGTVLALSDRADGAAVLEALKLGVHSYLLKGTALRTLADAARRTASGERLLDPELERGAVIALGRFARKTREGSETDSMLTKREREILGHISQGLTMHQIGTRLGISPRTVETHVAKLYRKLGATTRVQAVARAASLGLIDLG